jgi:sugar-specific transcriptional regulator TrmB
LNEIEHLLTKEENELEQQLSKIDEQIRSLKVEAAPKHQPAIPYG